nr:hypothetical protein [uncultured Carboxylicivirga sp.]
MKYIQVKKLLSNNLFQEHQMSDRLVFGDQMSAIELIKEKGIFIIQKGERKREIIESFSNEDKACNYFYLRVFHSLILNKVSNIDLHRRTLGKKGLNHLESLSDLVDYLSSEGVPAKYYNYGKDLKSGCFSFFEEGKVFRNVFIDHRGSRLFDWKNESPGSAIYRIFSYYHFLEEEQRLLKLGEIEKSFQEQLFEKYMKGFN